ncbi:MAG: peptidylprolyl isomerase [Desulfobacterales bacterium]
MPAHPYIKLETSEGDIILELDGRRAPVTVANFLALGQVDVAGIAADAIMPLVDH